MADDAPHDAPTRAEPGEDPLQQPAYLIFAYAAWAAGTWLVGPLVGLGLLVIATAALLLAALRYSTRLTPARFEADLGVILLLCCAGIGLGVLVVSALAG